jgi:hypothetical protein
MHFVFLSPFVARDWEICSPLLHDYGLPRTGLYQASELMNLLGAKFWRGEEGPWDFHYMYYYFSMGMD